jgi:hypothetical protein
MDVEIDRSTVCRYLGYKSDVEPSPRIASLLDEHVGNVEDLLEPSYSYVIKRVMAVEGSQALIEGKVVFKSEAIARLLSASQRVAVFIATIGNRPEEAAARLAHENLIVEAYVLDAIASSAVDSLADAVHKEIIKEAEALGLCSSRRFSPGHCDWGIGQQRKLFRALKGHRLGVALTEDCVMVPQKSTSGIVGLGEYGSNADAYNPCQDCDKRGCPWRTQG